MREEICMSKTKITKPKLRYTLKICISVLGSVIMILYTLYKAATVYDHDTVHWMNVWQSFLVICGTALMQIVLNSIVEVFTEKEI